jgi:ribosomal protein S18 acetylase RimI-like enzyme
MSEPAPDVLVRPIGGDDRTWVRGLLEERWGSATIVARGRTHDAASLPGFVALVDGKPAGLVTCFDEGEECEVVSLDSLDEGRGVGSALIQAASRFARERGCRRLVLVTTNDNLHALRFYQRRGFRLVALHPGEIDRLREIKPQISELGHDGIPIRDEIELEQLL